ncbi:AraC family transcriptional regulator [Paenibacillus albus]|uniref:AraC family transcriptional regulator n=1 Tax=Paenibacillus albus TaxID=2495582 RepID=A0A3Q8X498_9BACL|nr:AraC family transcriptional regulator [Paenibacillus albus]AZN40020.1 AraC family transcriptional regulator [Paenibacillus albus]
MEHMPTYTVLSNPVPDEHGDIYVLFSGESQTKPNHLIGPKVYDFYLMHHILAGTGTFSYAGTEHELQAGQSFLIHPDQLISYASSEDNPWRYRWIAFEGTRAAGLVAGAGLDSAVPIIDNGTNPRIGVLFHSIQRAFRLGGPSASLRASGYLHLLFAEFGAAQQGENRASEQQGSDSEALTNQMIRYMSTQYAEPISIENMAETLGYNRAYLSRMFKQQTGITPVTFLLKLRIDKAHLLLRERLELTIEQIAASVGFQDPLYFSKQFRRFYGQSPTAYREAMKQL